MSINMCICPYCNEPFETARELGYHKRMCTKRPDYAYQLSRKKYGGKVSTGSKKGVQRKLRYTYNLVCEKCGKPFTACLTESEFNKKTKYFCSRKCANSRVRTMELRKQLSQKMRTQPDKFCIKCGIKLGKCNKSGYCSVCIHKSEKYRHLLSVAIRNSGRSGGYRKGSGYGKCGWYKGYYCDSSWELAFVIYNLEHHLEFQRNHRAFEYLYKGQRHLYIPDFIQNGKYIEIKGYKTHQWEAKMEQFPNKDLLVVLYKDDMQPYLDYTISKYGNDFTRLYEQRE